MLADCFASFIFQEEDNNNYRVAFGIFIPWSEFRFLEIEYTDSGEVIHYHDLSEESSVKIFKKYQTYNSDQKNKVKFRQFSGNEKLLKVLDGYREVGCEYEHKPNCKCPACDFFCATIYRNDTLNRLIRDLGSQ